MRLVPQVAAERPTCLTLEAFELAAIAKRLGGRHNADRRGKTLFTELIDLCWRQDFGHGHRDLNATYIKKCWIARVQTEWLFGTPTFFTPWWIAGLGPVR